MVKLLNLLLFLMIAGTANAQHDRYVSLQQQTEVLENRKKSTSTIELYYDRQRLLLTKYYSAPDEMLSIANQLGELTLYYPARNEVLYRQAEGYTSKRSLLFYFTNNLTDDLGLADEGFTLTSRNYEGNLLVTEWTAPESMQLISRVKMVFEGANPVYAEYLTAKGQTTKKIYYSRYADFNSFRMPMRITEITYREKGDSIINRTLFSNVQLSDEAHSEYFNFKIPENAKPLTSN
ncbi:hypothetical protein [Roseimarinus sediminis]|uniref:hypothetical protein n=1 Tax=Roseimarinus sediminis TaxID=1610899 RepID=UPI003D258BBB